MLKRQRNGSPSPGDISSSGRAKSSYFGMFKFYFFCFLKKLISLGLEPGQPASM